MDSTELEVLSQVLAWLEQGHTVALVTVLRTWGSAPRSPGALLGIDQSGHLIGSVSSGCLEQELSQQFQAGAFQSPTLLRYGISTHQSQRVGLSCGGEIELLFLPLTDPETVRPGVLALQQRQLIARTVNLHTGHTDWQIVSAPYPLHHNSQQFQQVLGPTWQLLLIGAGQIARYLAEFAPTLHYQIILCDPRNEYLSTWQPTHVTLNQQMPDEAVHDLAQDQRTAIVTLTHDPRLDDLALLAAFETPAFYIGALGSGTTASQRIQRLTNLGVSQANLQRLQAPVGLSIGSRQPPEIAIAILAQLIAIRNQLTFPLISIPKQG